MMYNIAKYIYICIYIYSYIQYIHSILQYIYIYAYNIYKALSYFGKTICHHLLQLWPLDIAATNMASGAAERSLPRRRSEVRSAADNWWSVATRAHGVEIRQHLGRVNMSCKIHGNSHGIPSFSPPAR